MNREKSYRLVLLTAAGTAAFIFAPVLENLAGGAGIFTILSRLMFDRFCHQDPARSLVIAGALLPVCARCTGIYLGFLAGWGSRLLRHGPARDRALPRAVLFAGLLPLALDGAANWAGILDTPAAVRLVTGLLFGFISARALWPALLPALASLKLHNAPARPAGHQET